VLQIVFNLPHLEHLVSRLALILIHPPSRCFSTFAFQTQQSARVVFSSNKGRIFTKRCVQRYKTWQSRILWEPRSLSSTRSMFLLLQSVQQYTG